MAKNLRLFVYAIGLGTSSFLVIVENSKTVGELKEAILKEKPNDLKGIDADRLTLYKVELLDSEELEQLAQKAPKEKLGISSCKLSELFPAKPPAKTVSILVESVSSRKRSLSATEEVGRAAKRKGKDQTVVLPSDSALHSLHEKLKKIDPDPTLYSNPHNMVSFPFPLIGERLPAERFNFTGELHLEYMGRNVFSTLFQKVEQLKIGPGISRLYINGTMGYGKSHILAVLAGLLSRNGKRVVYLPDCRELVRNTMPYIQTSLLCAFADPLSVDVREEIRALESEDDVIDFCGQNRSMYFIMDQMNALDQASNEDTASNERKNAVQNFLHQLTTGQYEITSVSANRKTALHMKKKQTNEWKLGLMGGMSEDEMKQWWMHHDDKLPMFGDDDKARVEDLTGRIPLLLRPLLNFAEESFDEIEKDFWFHHDLVAVRDNVQDFAAKQRAKNEPLKYEEFYLSALVNCLTNSRIIWRVPESFDYRYFYLDEEGRGKYTCGLARQAAAVTIRQGSPGLLCDDMWVQSLRTFKNNPSVVGFLIKQACLSFISTTGFRQGGISWGPIAATIFRGDILSAIPFARSNEKFFIPEDPFFRDIDALYLKVDARKKMALVVPIQITVAKTRKDSETAFYSRWSTWQKFFPDYELTTSFVWVVEDTSMQSWANEEITKTTRNQSKPIPPEHKQIIVKVRDISEYLGSALESIRR